MTRQAAGTGDVAEFEVSQWSRLNSIVFHHNDRVHKFHGESNFLACGRSLEPFLCHLMNKHHIQAQQSYEPLVQLLTSYFCNSDPSFSHSLSMYHIDPITTVTSAPLGG